MKLAVITDSSAYLPASLLENEKSFRLGYSGRDCW